jgi:threonine/homoserine/homoserine lactone efflux protein
MRKLFIGALLGWLGYQFWTAHEKRQREKGRLDNSIPSLQGDGTVYV